VDALVLSGKLLLGGVKLGQHAVGALDELSRGGREPDPPAVALQQRDAGLALELGQRLRDGRRRVADRAGDGGDRSAAGELGEQPQPLDVEHRYRSLRSVVRIGTCS
jgi:hypothetical protein